MLSENMQSRRPEYRGSSSIMAVLFMSILSVLAISFTSMSNINIQMSDSHQELSNAQAAAESGLEYAQFLVHGYVPPAEASTPQNTVSESEARQTLAYFAEHVQTTLAGANVLNGQGIAWDSDSGLLRIPATGEISLAFGNDTEEFSLLFEFLPGIDDLPHQIFVTSTGSSDQVTRQVQLAFSIVKDSRVLEYAVATRGRMWITGDSTIHGDIYSSWDRAEISPFNMTADSEVLGTINTILSRAAIEANHEPYYDNYQLETLDADGNPLFDEDGHRIVSADDEIQGYHEGINYEVPVMDMPGMDIADYNTDAYNSGGLTSLPSRPTYQRVIEYFPHAAGNYSYPRDGTPSSTSNRRLERHVYENQHFTDTFLPSNRNALFRNCTFDGILYVDCNKNGSSYYNNVRFDNCTFNGPIITDVPQIFKWQYNCLYFTGSATFQNNAMEEATILAPHFNVNLGNTNPVEGETNELTGAIVGGIVDVRGNAEVYGTIISMADTTQWSSGYVTNIGATLGDGGSETTEAGDIGVIDITPDKGKMLPSGIKTPIVIRPNGQSYQEL